MAAPVESAFVGCGGHASGSPYSHFQFIDEIDLVAVVDAVAEKRPRMQRVPRESRRRRLDREGSLRQAIAGSVAARRPTLRAILVQGVSAMAKQSVLAGELELIVVFKVAGGAYYVSILGPSVSGIFSMPIQGNTQLSGAFSFVIDAKADKTPVAYSLSGTLPNGAIAGLWSSNNGDKGSWRADRITGMTNAGTWTSTARPGSVLGHHAPMEACL